jgi:hypothetical protein
MAIKKQLQKYLSLVLNQKIPGPKIQECTEEILLAKTSSKTVVAFYLDDEVVKVIDDMSLELDISRSKIVSKILKKKLLY